MDGNLGLKRTKRGKHSVITADNIITKKYFGAQKKVEKYAEETQLSREQMSTNNNSSDIVSQVAV